MTSIEALILGVVQGITEFLPVSSSGHLVLGEEILGLEVENLKAFDVVVHLGSLLAILLYFWQDIKGMFLALFGRGESEYKQLIGLILVGTIPAVIVGFTLEDAIDSAFRNVLSVGLWMTLIALYFLLAEWLGGKKKKKNLTYKGAVLVGLAQAFALIPGVSRSGSTIATGLLLGVNREKAARFSFLLGIPAIAGAGLLTAINVLEAGSAGVDSWPLITGFLSSFLAGWLSIWWLMKYLKKGSLKVFAAYLLLIGCISVLSSNLFV